MKRQCVLCKKVRPLDREHFNYRSVKDGKFGCICKACQKQYRAGHYQRNKAYYIEKAIKARSELRIRNRKLLREYLSTHPCVDCGIDNPLVLEFDHVRGKKAGEISRMITQNGWTTIMQEIEKCDVRCANCHRIKTAAQRNYYKHL